MTPSLRTRLLAAGASCLLVAVAPATAWAWPTVTPIATYDAMGSITSGSGLVAMKVFQGDVTKVLVGPPGQLSEAVGVRRPQDVGAMRLGTDAAGKPVLVYPRCVPDTGERCDLFVFDLATGLESRPPGVNKADTSEREGVMRRGAIVFSRQDGSSTALRQKTTLHLRPAGSRSARLVSRLGGEQLAFNGTRIAQIRDYDRRYGCGTPTVELLTLQGQREVVKRHGCGEDRQTPFAPAFVGRHLVYAYSSLSNQAIFRFDLRTKAYEKTPLRTEPTAFAPTGPASALLAEDWYPEGAGEGTPAQTRVLAATEMKWRPAAG